MNSYIIKTFADLSKSQQRQAAIVFVDGFYLYLKALTKDRDKLIRLFMDTFSPEHVLVCLHHEEVVGVVGYATQQGRVHLYDRKVMIRELGWLRGSVMFMLMDRSQTLAAEQCYIESLTTAEDARGKGVATALINHILHAVHKKEFILEVFDTNYEAIRLYERLGFEVYHSKAKRFFRKKAGYQACHSMRKHHISMQS